MFLDKKHLFFIKRIALTSRYLIDKPQVVTCRDLPQLIRKNERKFQNRQVTAERGPHNNIVG